MTAAHYHFVPSLKKLMNLNEQYRRVSKQVKSMPANHPQIQLLNARVEQMKKKLMVYRLMIDNEERNRLCNKLYATFLMLVIDNGKWGRGNNPNIKVNIKNPDG